MQCPVDGTALERHTVHSITIEKCGQCKGLWFEVEEFRKAKDEVEADLVWLDFDLWSDHESLDVEWSSRKCPQCQKNMATISYADTGVTVDYCVEKHGLWLDKGEFEAIIDALEEEISSRDVPEYIEASLQEARDIIVGDEGFASDWKDFLTVTRLLQYRVLVENPRFQQLISALQSTWPFR